MTNLQLLLGFLLNLAVALLVIGGIYYPNGRDKEYLLPFFMLNTSLYLVISLLGGIQLSVGLGLGLFVIFRVLRYRTEPVAVREMTYLFVLMVLPVINAVLFEQSAYGALLIADGLTVLLLYVVDRGWASRCDQRKTITYEEIELVKPENYDRLLADLRERTGLSVTRCEVGHIDFVRDVAELQVYHRPGSAGQQ